MKINYAQGRFLFYCLMLLAYSAEPEPFLRNILTLSLVLFFFMTFDFIYHFGKRILVLDFIAFYAAAAYLVAPSLSYYLTDLDWYEGYNFMPIASDRYFKVAIPGMLALFAGLNFPFKSLEVEQQSFNEKIYDYLKDKEETGVKLFWVGVLGIIIEPFAPGALKFFIYLSGYMVFIGMLYIWFSPMKNKMPYVIATAVLLLLRAMLFSMFGELIFWSIVIAMVLTLRVRIPFGVKIATFIGGLVFVIFLQSVKYEIRMLTWFDTSGMDVSLGDKFDIYNRLIKERVDNPDLLFGPLMLSAALDRTNQGSLTGMAIRYTPEYEPFAKGETIFLATLASFIPRAIWPDKPEIGGKENMRRFTGFEVSEGTSMDIGQLGDAYVNFGAGGGAVFLFFYGFLFCFIYSKMLGMASIRPTIILWIPLFFVGVVHADTSVLACMGHIIKVSIFSFIFFWGYKKFFGAEL